MSSTVYVGEGLYIAATVINPVTRAPINTGSGTADFFNPTKNPSVNVGDRVPDHTFALNYDDTTNQWIGTVDTTGWAAGKWWVRVTVTGDVAAWTYQSLTLTA